MRYRTIARQAEREYPIAPRELWDALANTDHLDRSINMPHVFYGPLTVTAGAFYREATARFGRLLRLTWREYPFEWVRDQAYSVVRLFEGGRSIFSGAVWRFRATLTGVGCGFLRT